MPRGAAAGCSVAVAVAAAARRPLAILSLYVAFFVPFASAPPSADGRPVFTPPVALGSGALYPADVVDRTLAPARAAPGPLAAGPAGASLPKVDASREFWFARVPPFGFCGPSFGFRAESGGGAGSLETKFDRDAADHGRAPADETVVPVVTVVGVGVGEVGEVDVSASDEVAVATKEGGGTDATAAVKKTIKDKEFMARGRKILGDYPLSFGKDAAAIYKNAVDIQPGTRDWLKKWVMDKFGVKI